MMQLAGKTQQYSARVASKGVTRSPSVAAHPIVRGGRQVVRAQEKTKESEINTNLSQEQLNEIGRTQAGEISPKNAELRADMKTSVTDLTQMQAFDGPAPETINGRLSMLGVVVALIYEFYTGLGLKEQVADHSLVVIASFVIISIATHVPLRSGVTRKEPYENGVWTAKAENLNGRVAMMGFLGMVIAEAVSGVNSLQTWGLQ